MKINPLLASVFACPICAQPPELKPDRVTCPSCARSFEHLREPKTAAAEIFRILKPEGSVAIHPAFLQALHEEPAHFYKATAYGVSEWFSAFEIEQCQVSANFSPGYLLAFLTWQVLEATRLGAVSAEEQALLSKTSLGEWAIFWARSSGPPAGLAALQDLPQSLQQRIAAGFKLVGRKPLDS